MNNFNKIIIALDVAEQDYALEIVDKLSDCIDIFKVGLELFSIAGPGIIDEIHKRGKRIFLDLKFHDIPTTVARAGVAAARKGVFMFNVHASGGMDMMKKCRDEVVSVCLKENIERPKIIAVTVLTSMSQDVLQSEIGIHHRLTAHVRHLAGMALKSGLDGVVASGMEASMIKEHCGSKFLTVTPGIRPSWSAPDDQSRTMTPRQAVRAGADFLVMGRSVLKHANPVQALKLISEELFC